MHPYVDPKIAAKTVRRKEHIELARKIAQSSITLLKMRNHSSFKQDDK